MALTIVGGTVVNTKALEDKLAKAFEQWTRFDVNDHFRDEFFEEKWQYDRDTQRKNGDFIPAGTRDIYDLGNLYRSGRDSFDVSLSPSNAEASWNWNATNSSGRPYAKYVHDALEGTNVPFARPWTQDIAIPSRFEQSTLKGQLLQRIRTMMGQ
jgi:hypothetical protein